MEGDHSQNCEAAQPVDVFTIGAGHPSRGGNCRHHLPLDFPVIAASNRSRPLQATGYLVSRAMAASETRAIATPAGMRSYARNWRGARRVAPDPSLSEQYQPACKPGFVGHRPVARTIRDGHSSGTPFARGLKQPTRTASKTSPCSVIADGLSPERTDCVAVPIRFCSRCGLPCRFRRRIRGALLPHLFTLTAPKPRRAKAGGSFSVALSLGSPPPDVIRHRMSMEPGLSSPAAFRP